MPNAGPVAMGIVGTAGRRDDLARLDRASYARMLAIAEAVAAAHGTTRLVSGGAAWADHVAVGLALWEVVAPGALTLHLPAALGADGRYAPTQDGRTADHHHNRFGRKACIDSRGELAAVVAGGAATTVSDGFLARNAKVAAGVDVLLAFTFGAPGSDAPAWEPVAFGAGASAAAGGLKPGGTAHTWSMCRAAAKIHVRLA